MFDTGPTRREFLSLTTALLSTSLASSTRGRWLRAHSNTLVVGVVSADPRSAHEQTLMRGFEFGIDEANQTAAMFGYGVTTRPLVIGDIAGTTNTARSTDHAGIGAYVGGLDAGQCARIADVASSRGVVYLNAGCAADSLRREGCTRTMFHVAASDAMLGDAVGISRAKLSDSERSVVVVVRDSATSTTSDSGFTRLQPTEWHHTLERFGAGQVNDRFRARYPSAQMDGAAWCGWFAIKIITEAMLRTRKVDPASLISFLGRDTTRFDGQKGVPLSFRSWDRQLRQPLYVVRTTPSGQRAVSVDETPDGRVAGDNVITFLDRLGDSAQTSRCSVRP